MDHWFELILQSVPFSVLNVKFISELNNPGINNFGH